MDSSEELRRIVQRLGDIYKAGDFAGYLAHYAPDISVFFAGTVMTSSEVRQFIAAIFESGGRVIDFQIGSRDDIQFSESGDAAIVSFPWRERFRFADGRETDTAYHQSEVWFRRAGEWKIAHIHLSMTNEHPAAG